MSDESHQPIGPFAMTLALILATTDLTPAECVELEHRLRDLHPSVSPDTGEAVTQIRAIWPTVQAER